MSPVECFVMEVLRSLSFLMLATSLTFVASDLTTEHFTTSFSNSTIESQSSKGTTANMFSDSTSESQSFGDTSDYNASVRFCCTEKYPCTSKNYFDLTNMTQAENLRPFEIIKGLPEECSSTNDSHSVVENVWEFLEVEFE